LTDIKHDAEAGTQCPECSESFNSHSAAKEHVLSHPKSFLFKIPLNNGKKEVTYYRQEDFTFHCQCTEERFKTVNEAKLHLGSLNDQQKMRAHYKYQNSKPRWLR